MQPGPMAAGRIGFAPVARDAAAGALELGLAGLQDVADERSRPRLELELGGRQGEVHRGQGCTSGTATRRRGSRDAGRPGRSAARSGRG